MHPMAALSYSLQALGLLVVVGAPIGRLTMPLWEPALLRFLMRRRCEREALPIRFAKRRKA